MPAYRTISATIYKEWLLLRRDWGGLLMLLAMPAALIIIMALVQDAPFRDYQEIRFDLLLADEDNGALSAEIKTGLRQSKSFRMIDSIDGRPVTPESLIGALQQGNQSVGIVIPKGGSAEIINTANIIANKLAAQLGTGTLPARESRDSVTIGIYFDPVSRPAFRLAIRAAMEKFVTAASTKLLVSRISRMSGDTGSDNSMQMERLVSGIGVSERVLGDGAVPGARINSVQHNVPAWAIFGMFFIVVPLSGHIIREREEGSALRVRLIPGAAGGVAIGRILFNTIICCAQFVLMCCVGIWVLPLFGLSSLSLGAHPTALLPVIVATAVCATSYGYLLGTVFRSNAQALPFGSISIVILSALGGIWVPVELLPGALQVIARISPLHWALEGIQHVLLRDGGWYQVLPSTGFLIALSASMWAFGLVWERRTRTS